MKGQPFRKVKKEDPAGPGRRGELGWAENTAIYKPIDSAFCELWNDLEAFATVVEEKSRGFRVIDLSAYVDGRTRVGARVGDEDIPHRCGSTSDAGYVQEVRRRFSKEGFQSMRRSLFPIIPAEGQKDGGVVAEWSPAIGSLREADPQSAQGASTTSWSEKGSMMEYVTGTMGCYQPSPEVARAPAACSRSRW